MAEEGAAPLRAKSLGEGFLLGDQLGNSWVGGVIWNF